MFPKKFQNKTNGVTPRRWIRCANPALAQLYDEQLKTNKWAIDLEMVSSLQSLANDQEFQRKWAHIKLQNKLRLKDWVKTHVGTTVSENSLFDVQVKRIHEYKRQLMNAFFMIHRYLQLKEANPDQLNKFVARSCFVGGKAAPAYFTAKKIIKLIGSIQQTVNNDLSIQDKLKVVFLPNYNVSNAQVIIPASELSQHISTAGTEASGTSNMKFCMNGGLIIGTLDGANVEIAEEVGQENMFIFGAKVEEINQLKKNMMESNRDDYIGEPLRKVFQAIDDGMFGDCEDLKTLVDSVRYNNDFYLVCHDFNDYLRAQEEVDRTYVNQRQWQKMSILNAVLSSKFSSDRTIHQYAQEIWNIGPIEVPEPTRNANTRMVLSVEDN